MKKTNYWKILITGLLKENPVFVLILGTCPTLAMSNSVTNAVGMTTEVDTLVKLSANVNLTS